MDVGWLIIELRPFKFQQGMSVMVLDDILLRADGNNDVRRMTFFRCQELVLLHFWILGIMLDNGE